MLTAAILTKNEENNIIDCIESLGFADNIIVIDNFSTDNTEHLIKNLKQKNIRLEKHDLANDFASQRNFALSVAPTEWVLFIDADERVSTDLAKEIQRAINENDVNGYYIKRADFMWGKKLLYGETGNIYLLRLAKKTNGKWKGKVHEVWDIEGPTKKLQAELFHYPHQTISEFLARINFYTTIRASELFKQKKRVTVFDVIFYPCAKFVVNHFIKQGFKDGIEGFIVSILMSFHSFLVRAKLYILWQN